MITRLNNRRKRNAGFTLIEMLVAVLIMGILLAVAIPLYLSSVKNTEDNLAKNNLKTLATAATAYRVKNNIYPTMAQLLASGDVPTTINDGTISYTTTTSTQADEVIVATAAAGTFTTGTTWTYTASSGSLVAQ